MKNMQQNNEGNCYMHLKHNKKCEKNNKSEGKCQTGLVEHTGCLTCKHYSLQENRKLWT
jgi:hypothetical protein